MERKLSVKKERLSELSTDELTRVAAGVAPATLKLDRDCLPTVFGCTTAINCPRPADA